MKKQNNMLRINQDEIHTYLLNIMKSFKKYAQNNGFDFTLCGGTTLGAIRHKGFIPWDDDVDIYISAETRKKLIETAKTNPYIDDEHRYKIMIPGTFPNVYPFIKIVDTNTILFEKNVSKKYAIGMYIDLFCLSYWPNSEEETKQAIRKQHFFRKMNQIVIDGNHSQPKRKLAWFILSPVRIGMNFVGLNSAFWCKKMLELDSFSKSDYVGDVAWPDGLHDRYKAVWFNDKLEIPFESETFNVPAGYHEILTAFYGDYMKLPPENKRIRHDYEAYLILKTGE